MYELPVSVEIGGVSHDIRNRGDYRAVLDTISALNDLSLKNEERAMCALFIFYENVDTITNAQEALNKMMWFINSGSEDNDKREQPKLMDWEQDFKLIVAPVNKVIGQEIRAMPYLHWWTFISAYYEIGESTFSTVVSIRNKKLKGKKLEKWEKEYYRDNRDMVELKTRLSEEEQAFINDILNR